MKTFTKKRGFFAVAAALLAVTVMLVTTWCSNDIGNGNEYTDDFTPPDGKGAVRLSFNEKITRTILPEDVTDISDFDEFVFQFMVKSGGTAKNVTVAPANISDAIILDPGVYDLTVIAYVDINKISDPGNPDLKSAATNGTAVEVTILAGKIAKETIVLKVYAPVATDSGTFSYTITGLSASNFETTDTATITLTPIATGTAQGPTDIKDKFTGTAQTLTVAAGYYYVDFILHVGADTVTFRHVVHIYKNMTSSYEFIVTLNYFNAVFKLGSSDITFEAITDKNPTIQYKIDSGSFLDYSTPVSVYRGQTIEFSVKNNSNFSSFEWYCLGTTTLSSANTCTIDTDPDAKDPDYNPFSTARDYNLTVVGTLTADSKKYATVVQFSVTP